MLVFNPESNEKDYKLNFEGSRFIHNHPLNYKGLCKAQKKDVLGYMESTEFKDKSKLKTITQKSEAYLQGKTDNTDVKIPMAQSAYLVRKAKEKVWGPVERDAQTLKELTEQLKSAFGDCLAEVDSNEENNLRNFVFSSPSMKALYKRFKDIILIDSTYRTNKYRLPLYVIGGVNENSKTFIIGFGVVSSEEAKNVKWLLGKLFNYLEDTPDLVCTDSCTTLGKVIRELLPQTQHLLCAWHVSQNIKKHLGGLSIFFFF